MLEVKSRSSCKDKHKVAETHRTKIHKTQRSDANVTKEKKKAKLSHLKKKKKKSLLLNGERKTLTEVFDVFLLHSLVERSTATRWLIQWEPATKR